MQKNRNKPEGQDKAKTAQSNRMNKAKEKGSIKHAYLSESKQHAIGIMHMDVHKEGTGHLSFFGGERGKKLQRHLTNFLLNQGSLCILSRFVLKMPTKLEANSLNH